MSSTKASGSSCLKRVFSDSPTMAATAIAMSKIAPTADTACVGETAARIGPSV